MIVQAMRRAAQIRSDQIATICGDTSRTWGEFADRCARIAAALEAFGTRPGDRVAILGLNSGAYLEVLYAILSARAAMVPMNIRWALEEHLYSLDDAGVGILFVDDAHAGMARQIAAARPDLRIIAMQTPWNESVHSSCEALVRQFDPIDFVDADFRELAGIFYTGGTTGHPKGVMHSTLSLWAGSTNLTIDARIPPNPRYLHAVPMFHLGDLAQSFTVTALAGTHVFLPGFAAGPVTEAVRKYRIQTINLVPTMIGMLLDEPGFDPADFSSIEMLKYGGSPASTALIERMRRAFPNARLVQDFGQTETAACGSSLHDDEARLLGLDSKTRSAGTAHYGCEIGVFDEDGAHRPCGAIGEVRVHSASAMMGYWNKPDLTDHTLVNGWVRTGDAGYLDEDGYLFLCDRIKDMIISGGENVYSAEVENAIMSHRAVAQAAVIGVPDDRWGERVHAVVVCRPGEAIDLDELQSHCRPLIAGYKLPRSLDIRDTPLPLSAVGKVQKTVLREPFWAGLERRIG